MDSARVYLLNVHESVKGNKLRKLWIMESTNQIV